MLADSPHKELGVITRHFTDMLGRRVTGILSPQPARLLPTDRWHAAWFTTNKQVLVGAMVLDHPLAVHFAAAFALMPVSMTANMIKMGRMDDAVADNLHECCNMCTKFFTLAHEGIIVLGAVGPNPAVPGREPIPANVRALLARPRQRLDVTLTVDGYGAGQLTLAVV